MFDAAFLTSFLQVIMIDLVLAGDNAVVIGLAAAGLPSELRRKAILIGIVAATRAAHRLRADRHPAAQHHRAAARRRPAAALGLLEDVPGAARRRTRPTRRRRSRRCGDVDLNADGTIAGGAPRKTLRQAVIQIIIADVSMSLDNVLAVAGAAREHPTVLIFGLALSIALMGIAASLIARLLQPHRWIAWVGLAIILYVALHMIWEGWHDVPTGDGAGRAGGGRGAGALSRRLRPRA